MPSTDVSAVIAKALSLSEPTKSEASELTKVAQEAKQLVESRVASLDEVADVVFGGSFAKGTWLRGDADIDIFVKIKPSVSVERFEVLGKSIGQEALKKHKPKLRYSDHPYVEAFVRSIRMNVVPCYNVEQGKWQSAADRSPFHTEYISSNFDDEKRMQARLLKKFFKGVGIYGAEISTGGFSGYVSEVLVLKYGSFENVLRAAADMQKRQIIAVGDYDSDIVKEFRSPVIIIDPVDSRRNLGTAISPESVGRFVLAARAFLARPSLQFFRKKKHAKASAKLYSNVLVVEFTHKELSPDIIWGQLKRSLNAMAKQLEIADFIVLRSSCITDEKTSAALAFLLESITLPPYTKRKGPEVFRRKDTASFISNTKYKKNKKPLVTWVDREMRVAMLVDRKATDARQFARSLLLDRIENSGVVKDLIADRKKLRIYSGSEGKIKGLALEAVGEVVSTEHLIFR
jgi:tRNA nucleotidyltransferase (CCA-adding enzyme)